MVLIKSKGVGKIFFLFILLDINECSTSPCGANAQCTDTQGSYTCACNDGYEMSGGTCTGQLCKLFLFFIHVAFISLCSR